MNYYLPRYILLVFLTALLCSACKKKEIQGPQGDPGTPGKGGNSDITASSVFAVQFADWVADSAAFAWNASVSAPLITKEVIETGSVKLFISVDNYWWELPYLHDEDVTQFGFVEGTLKMKVASIHGLMPHRPITSNYRLVVLKKI